MQDNDFKKYYKNELKKLDLSSEFPANLIIRDGEGNSTKTLSLNIDSCEVLIDFLTKLKAQLEKNG